MRRGFVKNGNGRCGMGQRARRGFGGNFREAEKGFRNGMHGALATDAHAGIEPEFAARFEGTGPGMGRGMGRGFGRRFNQGRFPDENEK
ncbi:hypothetical protein [Hydrogenimonas sp.]